MDEMQVYREQAPVPAPHRNPGLPGHPLHPHSVATPPSIPKVPSDYLRALRRRIWLVLVVAVPLGVLSTIWALRQPPIYQAIAHVRIEPPELDPILSTLVGQQLGPRNSASASQYVPDRIAQLQSPGLAELVVIDPRVVNEMNQFADPARELLNSLQVKTNWPKNSWNIVTIEHRDPVLAKKLLETLLDKFKSMTQHESQNSIEAVSEHARQNLADLGKRLKEKEDLIEQALKKYSKVIGPSGKNIFEEELIQQNSVLRQKEMQLSDVTQQAMIAQLFPKDLDEQLDVPLQSRLAQLEEERRKLTKSLKEIKRKARHFDSEPSAIYQGDLLKENLEETKELKSLPAKQVEQRANPGELILEQGHRELEAHRATRDELLSQLRDSMPGYQKYLELVQDRKDLKEQIAEAETNIRAFGTLSQSQHAPVQFSGDGNIKEPTVPVRPNRAITIAMGLIFSIGVGIALVCLLEHFDHRVKVPEHVTHGLTLPLLGVVPRMRRMAQNHRAGHLWTPGLPDSLEADAFRNIRASLLGVADRSGPIVTLLVTSAKAGEGKSTAALNLAATFAKAGERTLLLDVDLRRGSLGDVFGDEEEDDELDPKRGLVDILRGRLPWQCTVRRTPIANLDFIPTGDMFDIPIEILGTRELKQLILALSHHYDRVILDGPAVLGLADCLVLGRLVDSTLLVVRSGAHQLTTLYRAKGMLEQARVSVAGVVFNSLSEGLESWSSYVSVQPALSANAIGSRGESRPVPASREDSSTPPSEDEETFEFADMGSGGRA